MDEADRIDAQLDAMIKGDGDGRFTCYVCRRRYIVGLITREHATSYLKTFGSEPTESICTDCFHMLNEGLEMLGMQMH
jgi:hypothetical protein